MSHRHGQTCTAGAMTPVSLFQRHISGVTSAPARRHRITYRQAGARFDRGSDMDRFFGLSDSGTTFGREIFAASTFLTMAFIVAVNPMFLQDAGIPFEADLSRPSWRPRLARRSWGFGPDGRLPSPRAWVSTPICLWARSRPAVQLATGAHRRVHRIRLFLLFSLSRLRSWLIGAIPAALRAGITAGIGLFSP